MQILKTLQVEYAPNLETTKSKVENLAAWAGTSGKLREAKGLALFDQLSLTNGGSHRIDMGRSGPNQDIPLAQTIWHALWKTPVATC